MFKIGKANLSRKAIVSIGLTLILLATVCAAAFVYWHREITYEFKVVGIDAQLLPPSFDGYNEQIIATALTTDGKIGLAIIKENFYDVWLNTTWASDADGVTVTLTGQYYELWWSYYFPNPDYTKNFVPAGDSFSIPLNTSFVVDKTKMMLVPLVQPSYGYTEGNHGFFLMLSFAFDTELVTVPGDYTVSLSFDMGFS